VARLIVILLVNPEESLHLKFILDSLEEHVSQTVHEQLKRCFTLLTEGGDEEVLKAELEDCKKFALENFNLKKDSQ